MSLTESISICFSKYATFSGKASRSEYWWFFLFGSVVTWCMDVALNLQILNDPSVSDNASIASTIVSLILLVPSLAAGSRRLHDINKSGWWQLLGLTIIGLIPLVIWLAKEGITDANQN
jgi:uncharacterized membrane protein YhaH (DUF805 family)